MKKFENILFLKNIYFIIFLIEAILYIFNARWFGSFPYDSSVYWTIGNGFINNHGSFSLLNPNYSMAAFKGYFFPLFLFIQIEIAHLFHIEPMLFIGLCNAFWLSVFVVYILPKFFNMVFNVQLSRIHIISYILLSQFFLYFWGGYLFYPLSDFPSLGFYILAVMFFYVAINKDQRKRMFLFSGIIFAAAYNIRSVYLFGFIACMVYTIVIFRLKKELKKKIVCVLFCMLGFLIFEMPQYYINIFKYHKGSPMILNGGTNTEVLNFGKTLVDYFTMPDLGGESVYDPTAQKLYGDRPDYEHATDFVKYFLSRPFYNICFSVKKLFISMDIKYDSCYLLDFYKDRTLFRNLNYFIFFLGIISFFITKITPKQLFMSFLAIFPALICIFGHVETRYFMAIYALIYYRAAFVTIPILIKYFRKHKFNLFLVNKYKTVCFLLFFIAFFSIMNYMSATVMALSAPLPYYSNKVVSRPSLVAKQNINDGDVISLKVNNGEIYNIDFTLDKPYKCSKIRVLNTKYAVYVLPDFYRKNYHIYLNGDSSGVFNLKFNFTPNDKGCKITSLTIK